MAKSRKRVKIKGHYMQVRQRSTRKGKKGTILRKWKSNKKGKRRMYRCTVKVTSKLRQLCGRKRAGSYCFKIENRGSRCPQLLISYK